MVVGCGTRRSCGINENAVAGRSRAPLWQCWKEDVIASGV